MRQEEKPVAARPAGKAANEEAAKERERRFLGREVGPEDEERKSPGGPRSQVAPDVEPSGS
jgi:hypothetical protein